MAVKVLVNEIGQQIIADVKQVENKDTKEIVAYWTKDARVVVYNQEGTPEQPGNITVNFGPYCLVSDEKEFSIRANHIVSILEPRADVVAKYQEVVAPADEAPAQLETVEMTGDGLDVPNLNGAEAEPVSAV